MSTEKINQKEMDAFFEMLKATVSCGTVEGHGERALVVTPAHRAEAGYYGTRGVAEHATNSDSGNQAPPAGIFQGNSEPSADDPYFDDEPYWSDSDTNREKWNSIKGR